MRKNRIEEIHYYPVPCARSQRFYIKFDIKILSNIFNVIIE